MLQIIPYIVAPIVAAIWIKAEQQKNNNKKKERQDEERRWNK